MYDPSLAPPGKHIMGIFLQYAPYTLREGTWDELREPFGDRVVALIDEYAPGFSSLIEHRQVLSPLDLERRFGITGGNIFHGEMSLDQMFVMRPVAGWADHRTPIKGLYLCGAAAHPGGGVMGISGRNAAAEGRPAVTLHQRGHFIEGSHALIGDAVVDHRRADDEAASVLADVDLPQQLCAVLRYRPRSATQNRPAPARSC